MNFINHFILILLFVIFASCSKEKLNQSVIKEKSLDGQVLEAYSEGLIIIHIFMEQHLVQKQQLYNLAVVHIIHK